MNPNLMLCLALVLSDGFCGCSGVLPVGKATLRKLEQMAQTYSHFSLEVVVSNRPLRLWAPESPRDGALVAEQPRLWTDLRALSRDRKRLKGLLTNSDPKDRNYCAGWFAVKLARAGRRENPIRKEYVPDIRNVRRQIDELPADDKAWTLLWLSREWGAEALVTEQELLQACKELGQRHQCSACGQTARPGTIGKSASKCASMGPMKSNSPPAAPPRLAARPPGDSVIHHSEFS